MLNSADMRLTKLCENDRRVLLHYSHSFEDSFYHTFLSESCVMDCDKNCIQEINIYKSYYSNQDDMYPPTLT